MCFRLKKSYNIEKLAFWRAFFDFCKKFDIFFNVFIISIEAQSILWLRLYFYLRGVGVFIEEEIFFENSLLVLRKESKHLTSQNAT